MTVLMWMSTTPGVCGAELRRLRLLVFFFFNDTATTEIYTLSLHDALPISASNFGTWPVPCIISRFTTNGGDRKSTRLNSSHSQISYAVFCLKKKKRKHIMPNSIRNLVPKASNHPKSASLLTRQLCT